MSDTPEFRPEDFYMPGRQKFYSEQLNQAHDIAQEMVARLALGETVDLPDGVLNMLRTHAQGINVSGIGEFRLKLATDIHEGSAFDAQDAMSIGERLARLVEVSNEISADMGLTDVMETFRWGEFRRRQRRQHPPHLS